MNELKFALLALAALLPSASAKAGAAVLLGGEVRNAGEWIGSG